MNNLKNNYCVIMAGGVGTRFWPMSRTSRPKQFIDILGVGKTLIQLTFDRFKKVCPPENVFVVTNAIYKDLVLEQLPELSVNQVLCEPVMRNTAPCVAYANYKINEINPNSLVVVAPSDHIILNEEAFINDINSALKAASQNDCLLTMGIKPSRPDTGYGYIQFMEKHISNEMPEIKKVKTFTEKPSLEIAKSFLESGDFLWNSGIFIWSLKSIMNAFNQYLDDVDLLFAEGVGLYNTSDEKDFIQKTYADCKNISIDYGIMEKADNVYVLAVDFGWSDLGTWGSLYDIREKDKDNNAIMGDNVMLYDSKNCIVNVPKEKLVVLQGLKDYIVVEDNGTLLVCRKEDEQQIRQFVSDAKLNKGENFV